MVEAVRQTVLGSRTSESTALVVGRGALVGGGLSLLVTRIVGISSLWTVVGALAGGIYAAVANPWFEEDEPASREEGGAAAAPQPGSGEIAAVVAYLQEHLGNEVTAYLSGIEPSETEIVGRWATGEAEPEPLPRARLETAHEATHRILGTYDGKTAQSWFFGSWMQGEAPAYVLRHSATPETWNQVTQAAQEFVELTR